MFECCSWDDERSEVKTVLGTFDVATAVDKMISRVECWDAVSKFDSRVMSRQEDSERAKRGETPRVGYAAVLPFIF